MPVIAFWAFSSPSAVVSIFLPVSLAPWNIPTDPLVNKGIIAGYSIALVNGQVLVVKFRPAAPVDPLLLFQFVQKRPDVALKPPATLTVDLRGGAKGNRPPSNPSWWTSRARSNEVEADFSRVELHRSERSPDTPARLFSQVGTVLVELRGLQTIES